MPTPSALEICRTDLFTKEVELQERYTQVIVDKVLRIREMYNWFIANPDDTDAFFHRYATKALRDNDTLYISCESSLPCNALLRKEIPPTFGWSLQYWRCLVSLSKS